MQTGIKLSAYLLGLGPVLAFAEDTTPASPATSSTAATPAADTTPAVEQTPPPSVAPPLPIESTAPAPSTAPPSAPPPIWSGDLAAGYVKSSGNANASTLNVKFDLDWKSDPWENLLSGSAYKANSNGDSTDEKYSIGNKLLFNLNPDDYLFGQVNYDDDRFGAITERYSGSAGYGRHLLHTPTQTLDMDLGLGANRTREQDAHRFKSDVIGTFDATYIWKISANSQFKQTLRTEFGPSNTYVNPISELKLTIIKNFFAALGYEVRYNSDTPAGTHHTDQITTINVGYTFGKQPTTAPP
ncbi:MAG: hypothetical protein JWR16_1494 [Nevskia sp.]|nr:hypothetical protein [Nevskia sp.]